MSTQKRLMSRRTLTQAAWSSTWTHALIWLLLTTAALLLAGFTAVADDITQRGEQRRLHQSVSGSFLLPDEQRTPGEAVMRLLSVTGEKVARR